jgi:hypothetical protein
MRTPRIFMAGTLVWASTLAVAPRARAINTPDVNSAACTTANGGNGCFKITNNNTSPTAFNNSSAAGTAMTGVATGSGTAVKAFTDGGGQGVLGIATGNGTGVFGNAAQGSGNGTGVMGSSTNGTGVSGTSTNGTGITGFCGGSGTAISGTTTGPGTGARGVSGTTPNGVGVYGSTTGTATSSAGVYGTSGAGLGVYGQSTSNTALYGLAQQGGNGVVGISTSGFGSYGRSTSGIGVYGESASNTAIYGLADQSGNGVVGISTDGYGIYGQSDSNIAVFGTSSSSIALYGASTSSHGLYATTASASARAVFGYNSSGGGVGVWGESVGGSVAIQGHNTDGGGWAGYFEGNLGVTGTPRANQSTFSLFSDARLKKNIQPLEGALQKLLKLRGVTFEWKEPAEHGNQQGPQVGFIAQDVEKVFPTWVTNDPSGFKTVTTRGMEAMIVESLRSLQAENKELRSRLAALEADRGRSRAGLSLGGWGVGALFALGGVFMVASRRRQQKSA